MLVEGIHQRRLRWLFYLWASGKNFIGDRNLSTSLQVKFEQFFDIIIRSFTDNEAAQEEVIKHVLDWRIETNKKRDENDNIIEALLAHHFDKIAIEYMGYFNNLLNDHLFVYCIRHGNNNFLKNALVKAAFDKMIFREDIIIDEMLSILKDGHRTNFLLNILVLIDISVWKNKYLKDLIEIFQSYASDTYDKNRLLLSSNPLLTIALACEILNKVASARRKYESECFQI